MRFDEVDARRRGFRNGGRDEPTNRAMTTDPSGHLCRSNCHAAASHPHLIKACAQEAWFRETVIGLRNNFSNPPTVVVRSSHVSNGPDWAIM
eukprot:gene24424-10023_t